MSGLRVTACVPIAEIGNDSKNNGFYLQPAGTNSAFTATVCDVNPYELPVTATNASTVTNAKASWISPHVPLLSLAFDRYRMQSLAFHYEPQSTATTADRMVFAWTDDPNHPFLSASATLFTDTTPTQLQQLVTKDSQAFMPWKEWSMSVPVARDLRFMYNEDDTGSEVELATFTRFSSFGSMSCTGSSAPGTAAIYGVLYATLVLDLLDPVPIVSATEVVSLISSVHRHRRSKKNVRKTPPITRESETKEELTPVGVRPDLEVGEEAVVVISAPLTSTRSVPTVTVPGGAIIASAKSSIMKPSK